MKKIKVDHIYDCYPLYRAIYGQDSVDRARDVQEAVAVAQIWVETFCPGIVYPKVKKELKVIELFSGTSSEHEPEFRRHLGVPVAEYYYSDIAQHPDTHPRVIIGDVTSPTFLHVDSVKRKSLYAEFDMVLAFYFSAGSFLKEADIADPYTPMENMMQNACGLLKKGGIFILDNLQNPVDSAFDAYRDGDEVCDVPIYGFHPLRAFLGLPIVGGDCTLTYTAKYKANRLTFMSAETLTDIHVKFDGKKVATFTIEEPFLQCAFTEGELVRAAKHAGFRHTIYLNDYTNPLDCEVYIDDPWITPVKGDTKGNFATKLGFVR